VSNHEIVWPDPPSTLELRVADVHLWAVPLALDPDGLAERAALLAPAEQERAMRFRFARERGRFIASRSGLRAILASYLERDPEDLEFDYGPRGKPCLAAASPTHPQLEFNLSHSEDLALIAVKRGEAVGVDLERIRPLPDAGDLAARFFSARENELIQSLSEELRPVAFLQIWTRKEACLKASGEGIGHFLRLANVVTQAGDFARRVRLAGDSISATEWSLQELSPASGFVAAVATTSDDLLLSHWRWPGGQSRASQ
jgi:4'-phosphopantetheinyl transferase